MVLLLAGCSLFDTTTDEPATTTSAPVAATTTTTVPATPPTIEVIDPGAAPRTLIRYALVAGSTTEIEVVTSITIRQEEEGLAPTEIASPPVRQRYDLSIGEVTGAEADISMMLTAVELADGSSLGVEEAEAMNAELAELIGIEGTGTMIFDGRLRSFEWSGAEGLDPQLRRSLEALSGQLPALVAPLPETPVGAGATWRATSTPTVDGTATELVTTYTMDGVLGTAMAWSSTTTGNQDDHDLPASTLEGATVTVTNSASTALAGGTADLASLMVRANIVTTVEQDLVVTRGSDTRTVHQTITTNIAIDQI